MNNIYYYLICILATVSCSCTTIKPEITVTPDGLIGVYNNWHEKQHGNHRFCVTELRLLPDNKCILEIQHSDMHDDYRAAEGSWKLTGDTIELTFKNNKILYGSHVYEDVDDVILCKIENDEIIIDLEKYRSNAISKLTKSSKSIDSPIPIDDFYYNFVKSLDLLD